MKKKTYMKPGMKVVKLQHKPHLLVGSGGYVRGVSSDGFYWENTDGIDR